MPYLSVQVGEISYLSPNVSSKTVLTDTNPKSVGSTEFPSGAKTNVTRSTGGLATTGSYMASFVDVFYNRIYVDPLILDMTGMSDNSSTSFSVWNAYFVDKHLTAVNPTGLTGVTLTGSTSKTFIPLEYYMYSVTLTPTAPVILNGTYVLDFSDAPDTTVYLTGVRSQVFPFPHNFDTAATYKLQYQTDIIETHSGKEQRIKMRRNPRVEINYQSILFKKTNTNVEKEAARAAAFYSNMMSKWHDKGFLLPMWMDARHLASSVSSGATSISTPTQYLDYYDGGYFIIWNNYDNYEVLKISTVGSGVLNINGSVANNWTAGATIAPLRRAFVTDEVINGNRVTPYIHTATHNWKLAISELKSKPKFTTYTSTQYRGYDTYMPRFDYGEDRTEEFYRPFRILDNSTGVFQHDARFDMSKERTSLRLVLKDEQAFSSLLGFIDKRSGRYSPVWIPTFNDDFQLSQNILNGANSITVKYTGYKNFISQADSKRDLIFFHKNGTNFIKRVTNSVLNNDMTETLTLDSVFSSAYSIGDFTEISYLQLVRLESDEFEFQYETANKGTITFNVVEVFDMR